MDRVELVKEIRAVEDRLGGFGNNTVGLVTGTGLGGLSEALADRQAMATADIPGFPRATAPGHTGLLARGTIGGRPVALLG